MLGLFQVSLPVSVPPSIRTPLMPLLLIAFAPVIVGLDASSMLMAAVGLFWKVSLASVGLAPTMRTPESLELLSRLSFRVKGPPLSMTSPGAPLPPP